MLFFTYTLIDGYTDLDFIELDSMKPVSQYIIRKRMKNCENGIYKIKYTILWF